MGGRRLTLVAVAAGLLAAACAQRDTPEEARRRALKLVLEKQVAGLGDLAARQERGDVDLVRPLAIGISEDVFRQLLNATLPQEGSVKDHFRVRLERADVYFRGTSSIVDFGGRLTSTDFPNAFVKIRLAGGLGRIELVGGRLISHVKLYHFEVQGTSLGNVAKGVIEALVRDNLVVIEGAIPKVEIPVSLEEGISISGFGDDGPVSVGAGRLPLKVGVNRILPLNQRLWILLDVQAGPWQNAPEVARP